jgi:hypothetical protein
VAVVAAAVAVGVAVSRNLFPISPEKNTMKFKHMMKTLAMALLIAMAPAIDAAQPLPATRTVVQQGYATPEDAARALAEAVRAQDREGCAGRGWPGITKLAGERRPGRRSCGLAAIPCRL